MKYKSRGRHVKRIKSSAQDSSHGKYYEAKFSFTQRIKSLEKIIQGLGYEKKVTRKKNHGKQIFKKVC